MANRATRRASGASYPNAAAWSHARILRGLELPANPGQPKWKVDFEVPDLEAYVARGTIPNPLIAPALQVMSPTPRREEEMPADERAALFDLKCWVVATHLRKPDLVAQEGSLEAAIEFVATKMPTEHRDFLVQHGLHLITPQDIEEVMRSLGDLVPFRDGTLSAEPVPRSDGNGKVPV